MCQSSVPPAVAPSFITVCSSSWGDVASYGARRVTDALRRSQIRELAAADDRTVNRLRVAWPFQHTGRHAGLFDTLSASAADNAVPETHRPWTSTTTANS
jgi:hypothetical protein